MSLITDNWFARITRETLVRNPNTAGALTWNDIAFNNSLTINEKISTITWVDLTASNVANVASGNLVATNVQNALNELQTKIDTRWDMLKADNLSGLTNYNTARTNLWLGSLATQSGTFSGISSGTNSWDNSTNTNYTSLATILATANSWTAVQTFLSGMMGLRNVANTFTSFFTNSNTGSRTYSLKDASWTIAFTSDITGINSGTNTGDQTIIVGITGTLAQFNTAVTDADLARTDAANTFTGTQNITQIDLWNTDTSLTRVSSGQLGIEWVRAVTTSPLVLSAASYTTDTGTSLNMDNLDMFIVTAQAGALLFNSPGGTLAQGRKLIIRIKDNWTARLITWNAVFRAMAESLPTTTVISKTLYLGFIYNSTDTKWDLVAKNPEA